MAYTYTFILVFLCIYSTNAARLPRQNDLSQFGLFVGEDGIVRQNPNFPINPTRQNGLLQSGFFVGDDGIVRRDPNFQIQATTPQNNVPTTASPQYLDCLSRCGSTQEYNPVCGSDMLDYRNAGRLSCAQRCGKDVQQIRMGTCLPL